MRSESRSRCSWAARHTWPPSCSVEAGAGQVGDEQRHRSALQLVLQVEHQAGVAGEARQVVHGDGGDFAGGEGREECLVAISVSGEARVVST